MIVSLSVSLLWLCALLAAACHLRDGGRTVGSLAIAVIAFALTIPLALWLTPQPNWVGVLIASGVFWRLIAGPLPRVGAWLAGSSAGLAAALQIAGGVSPWLAVPVTAIALLAALVWAGGSQWLNERVLIAVAIATPPIGLANDIIYGWQSATMLGIDGAEAAAPQPPLWAFAIVALAVVAGVFKGLWAKR